MATNRKKPPEDSSCLSSCCGLSAVFGYRQKRKAQTAEGNDPEIMRSKYSNSRKAKHGKPGPKPGQPGRDGTRHLDVRRTETKDSHELIGNLNNAVKSIPSIGKKRWVGTDGAATAVVADPNPTATAAPIKELKDHKTGRSKAFGRLTKEARHEDDEPEFQKTSVMEIQEIKQQDTQKPTANGQISPNRMKTTWRPFTTKDEVPENPFTRPKKSTKPSDSVIGVWIIMIMFATLILWGRLCSIFCFSALLYMIPVLRRMNDNKVSGKRKRRNPGRGEEYKKKVTMKGILERQYKN